MVIARSAPAKISTVSIVNIFNELQKDGRISNVELSKRVGTFADTRLERVSPSDRLIRIIRLLKPAISGCVTSGIFR